MLTNREIGERIRRAREEGGVPRTRLAEALGVDDQVVLRLEDGTLEPFPGDYVLIAARVLTKDFRSFISTELDEIEEETRRVYRALAEPSPADLLAVRRFMLMCTVEDDLEALLREERRSLPPVYPPPHLIKKRYIDQAVHAAQEERARLKLGNHPIGNVFELLRSQGCRVFRHTIENSALSGLTVMHPQAGVSILVNYDDDMYRQLFSAAHEYAHVLFDRQQIQGTGCVVSYRFSKDELIEIRANRFASHFLLPPPALERYPRPKNVGELTQIIKQVALDYLVNTETVARQLRDAGWMTERTFKSFREKKPVVVGHAEKHDPDMPTNITETQRQRRELATQAGVSQRLLELLRSALIDGHITFGRFAEVLDMTVSEAQDFVRSAGVAL
jgi:Zn-dependent peptidase ImmA (M78 family)/transcriptional regulator with XRE-family HTH domain